VDSPSETESPEGFSRSEEQFSIPGVRVLIPQDLSPLKSSLPLVYVESDITHPGYRNCCVCQIGPIFDERGVVIYQ
jgi:hypothetical protein